MMYIAFGLLYMVVAVLFYGFLCSTAREMPEELAALDARPLSTHETSPMTAPEFSPQTALPSAK